MLVIFGTRFYGEIDSYGGQRQLTKFFHIYYLPLMPVDTLWVTRDLEEGVSGHPVKMSGRSLLAGYTRVWGPVAAIGAFLAGNVSVMAIAGALAAVSVWTWSWRAVRSAREQRRSDFHLLAFGTRCDPLKMDDQLAATLQSHVSERWAEVADGNSPEDIARLGAATPVQAVLAYASLRFAARLAPGDDARRSLDASERILDAVKDRPALDDGPYRSPTPPPLPASASGGDPAGR